MVMPNWCQNALSVSGPGDDIAWFRMLAQDKAGETDLSLYKLYPCSEGLPDAGYHWCIEQWGTKWDVKASCRSMMMSTWSTSSRVPGHRLLLG
jgi:hypothetical protein